MAKKKSEDLNYLDNLDNNNVKKNQETKKPSKNKNDNKLEQQNSDSSNKTNNKIKVIETTVITTRFNKKGPMPDLDLIRKRQQEKLKLEEEEKLEKERLILEEKLRKERAIEEELMRKKMEDENKKVYQKKKEVDLSRVFGNLNVSKKIEKEERKVVRGDEGLKSPICCILGHVDTGKTKILDKLRETNVQGQEAGGITQQIGATFFPLDFLNQKYEIDSNLPGLLIIDTPGHESFSNLRSRGSSLCNLAILVVDFFHLLEPQTLESIDLLKMRRTPFIVALNKIDKIYEWDPLKKLEEQSKNVKAEFRKGLNETIVKFAQVGLNAKLWNENLEPKKYISLVPTSAITGQGLPILLNLIMKMSENFMKKKNTFSENFECVVLEVKNIEGFGTTIDVILVNGVLNENDKICVGTLDGPIVTKVRSILLPQACKDAKAKHLYENVKSAKASLGFKIAANDLERVITGAKVVKIIENEIDEDTAKKIVDEDLNLVFKNIKTESDGVHVQASTLGSLEALVSYLERENISVFSYSIGNLRKQDIIKASTSKSKTMLCFDIDDKEFLEFAKENKVKIFTAQIIYHLFDKYKKYIEEVKELDKQKHSNECIFPCKLKILPNCVFTKRSPLVLGVEILEGKLTMNTSLFVYKNEVDILGKVTSIENNRKVTTFANKGDKVSIKIDPENDNFKMFNRHFSESDILYSVITRKSIDALKLYFKDEISKDVLLLLVELKGMLGVI